MWKVHAIPDEMAQVPADEPGLQMASYDLSQLSYVAHTRTDGWHRLVTPSARRQGLREWRSPSCLGACRSIKEY
jgi:hypothetical protein